MKNYLNILLALFILTSCGDQSEKQTEKSGETEQESVEMITMKGSISGAEGKTLTLNRAVSAAQTQPLDSIKLGKDGSFEFSFPSTGIAFYTLQLPKKMPLSLFIENGDEPYIESSFDDYPKFSSKGMKHTGYINEYLNNMVAFQQNRYNWLQQSKSLPFEESEKRKIILDSIKIANEALKAQAKKTIEQNPGSPAMIIPLMNFFPQTTIQNYDTTDLEFILKVKNEMAKEYSNTLFYKQLDNDYQMLSKQIEKLNRPKDIAPEINLPDPNGNYISLSSLKGKVVLVDFWASWCGPCRRENPNVVRLYNKYKDQGFTVYSVSLDGLERQKGDPKQSWMAAIKQDGLSWPNHVSSLKGWQTEVLQDYGINSIPYTVLLDREGKIIGEKLRGPALEQKLNEIFTK